MALQASRAQCPLLRALALFGGGASGTEGGIKDKVVTPSGNLRRASIPVDWHLIKLVRICNLREMDRRDQQCQDILRL